MAELTYSDIREAIVEALSEHDRYTARHGSADQKIRKETNQLTKDLLESVQLGFKERKSQDKEFLDKLEKKIFQDKQKSFANEDGTFGFGTKIEKSFGNFLNKSFTKLDQYADKFSKNMTLVFAQRWNAMSNEATQQVVNSIKSLNTSGIAQDWDQFSYSLRDSTIRLEDFIKATQQHNTALQILNKSTGNAAGTYQNLAKSAADFAVHQGKVAYDNGQLSDAIGAYLEMQRSVGNLDKLNEKEMQNGVNRLIVSADRLSKEFGLNRDELLKSAQKENVDVDVALAGMGYTNTQIEDIKMSLATLSKSNPELAKAYEKMIATGGYDANSMGMGVLLNSPNVNRAFDLIRDHRADVAGRILASQETMEQIAKNAPSGDIAGILNMKGNEITSEAMKAQLRARQAVQTKGANTKTDQTIVSEQAYRNELIKKENNEIALLAKSAAGARAQFTMLTYSVMALNGLLSAGVWSKNLINMFAPFLSQLTGVGSGLLTMISYAASIFNQLDSFRTASDIMRSGGMNASDLAMDYRARGALRSADQVKGLRRLAGKKPWVKGAARWGARVSGGVAKVGTRIVGGLAKAAPWAIAADIGSGVVDAYGAQGLEALGVGKKSAKITSNAASSALSGAAWGATIGSIIPGVGTAIGAGIGALVGGAGSLLKAAFGGGEKKKESSSYDQNYEDSPMYEQQQQLYDQQGLMLNELKKISRSLNNVDYNTYNFTTSNI